MNIEACKANAEREKNLMNALADLEQQVKRINSLVEYSNQIRDKLYNPKYEVTELDPSPQETIAGDKTPTLVDLFNEVSIDFDIAISKIRTNIERLETIIG